MPKRTQHKSKRVAKLRQKKSSWKVLQLNRETKRKIRTLGLTLTALFSTLIIFAAISLYHYLENPLVYAEGGLTPGHGWDLQARYNLLLLKVEDSRNPTTLIKNLAILSMDPKDQSLLIVDIPVDTEINLPNYGNSRVSGLYASGNLAAGSPGVNFVEKSLTSFTGATFDGYLLIDAAGESQIRALAGKPLTISSYKESLNLWHWPALPKLFLAVKENVRTNLSLPELINVGRFAYGTRFDKVTETDLGARIAQGGVALEDFLGRNFVDQKIYEEGLRVIVLNGTNEPGLAGRAARVVEHLGANVVDVDNTAIPSYQKTVLITKKSDTYTTKRLATLLSITDLRLSSTIGQDDPLINYIRRADVVIIAGLDILTVL